MSRHKSVARIRENRIVKQMQKCVHFEGVFGRETCEAGVNYAELAGGGMGMFKRLPCLGDVENPVHCGLRLTQTREQAEAEIDEDDRALKEWMESIADGVCPACRVDGRWRQVGRCVYCNECGHRIYQGTLPETKR